VSQYQPNNPLSGKSKLPMMWNSELANETEEEDWNFYIEAMEAWRAWRVIELDSVLLLQSITYRTNWIPRQEMQATCVPSTSAFPKPVKPHLTPSIEHGCGIYSVKTRLDALRWRHFPSSLDTVVYGRASIWGNVFLFTKGYISEFAYPSHLLIPQEMGKDLESVLSQEELSYELRRTYVVETELL
jgi:hypothetical protein